MEKIPTRETITCEFKSDLRCLPDRALIEAVVCMANGDGGDIYLGVEDDGNASGVHAQHQDLDKLTALIANNTQPAIQVHITPVPIAGVTVAKINVAASVIPVSTSDGVFKRRQLQCNGEPECVAFVPD